MYLNGRKKSVCQRVCQFVFQITLGACGLQSPVHNLELTKANIIGKPSSTVQESSEIDISDDDEENNDTYTGEEDMFEHEETRNSRKQTPLSKWLN